MNLAKIFPFIANKISIALKYKLGRTLASLITQVDVLNDIQLMIKVGIYV